MSTAEQQQDNNTAMAAGAETLSTTTTDKNETTVVAPSSTVSNRLVRLVSKEGDAFEVELNIMTISKLVEAQAMHDDDDVEEEEAQDILLPVVPSLMLARIIEFARHYDIEPMTEYERPLVSANLSEIVQQWYADFINVDNNVLVDLVNAVNYMDMTPLRSLCCAAIAVKLKDKTPDEMRANLAMPGSAPPSAPTDPVASARGLAMCKAVHAIVTDAMGKAVNLAREELGEAVASTAFYTVVDTKFVGLQEAMKEAVTAAAAREGCSDAELAAELSRFDDEFTVAREAMQTFIEQSKTVADTNNQAGEGGSAWTAAFDAAKKAVGIVNAAEEAKEANDNDMEEEEED